MLYAVRFSLPDRPGTLGSVATAISHLPAGIASVWVVERDGGYATDEMCVEAKGVTPDMLRDAVQAIPGVSVESVRRVERAPDPLSALQLAAQLAAPVLPPVHTLVEGLPEALCASWAIAFDLAEEPSVRWASEKAPVPGVMETPWLPLDGPRRLPGGDWMPQRWRMSRFEVAAASLGDPRSFVLAGRPAGMRWRTPELEQLGLLAALAARAAMPSGV